MSSSFTASLTERLCKAVIDSAIVTGFHAVASRSRARAAVTTGLGASIAVRGRAHHARVLAHRR